MQIKPDPANPIAYCRSCEWDFAGQSYFDLHRVGVHAYTYSEGLKMEGQRTKSGAPLEPPAEDGRRCLTEVEMRKKGWEVDDRGRWSDPRRAEALRAHHAKNEPDTTMPPGRVSEPVGASGAPA